MHGKLIKKLQKEKISLYLVFLCRLKTIFQQTEYEQPHLVKFWTNISHRLMRLLLSNLKMPGWYFLEKLIWTHGHMDHQQKPPIMVQRVILGTLTICPEVLQVGQQQVSQRMRQSRQSVLKQPDLLDSRLAGAVW